MLPPRDSDDGGVQGPGRAEARLGFPELGELFDDPGCRTAREVLRIAPTAAAARKRRTSTLADANAGPGHRRLGTTKAERLKAAASTSIAVAELDEEMAFEVGMLLDQYDLLEGQIAEADAHVAALLDGELARRLQTIPGVGPAITAGALIFASGNVSLIAQPFGQQSTVPGATTDTEVVAPVEFTAKWAFGPSVRPGSSEAVDVVVMTRRGAWRPKTSAIVILMATTSYPTDPPRRASASGTRFGYVDCPGMAPVPYVVDLPVAIGKRPLLDARVFPPQERWVRR